MSFLFGPERAELKTRMELIIQAEEKTVRTIKKHIIVLNEQKSTIDKLIQAFDESRAVMEKLLLKPSTAPLP